MSGSIPSHLLRVPIEVPNRSGFNMSHSNIFSGTTGTLIPVLCEELLPNDTVSLGDKLQVQLPPMVTDFYGRVDFVLEAFFVPNRLLWGGWQDFITHPTNNPQYPAGTLVQAKPTSVPYFFVNSGTGSTQFLVRPDSLLHFLDYGQYVTSNSNGNVSVLPAFAYHRIWDDWYRDSRIQSPLFYRPAASNNSFSLSYLPYSSVSDGTTGDTFRFNLDASFSDGVSISSLRQRNWVKDYFTTASTLPQAGGSSEVEFDTTSDTATGAGTGAFTISTLRAANSLQKWLERNNLAGYRYSDQVYAQFGIYPADAIMDRPLFLGRDVHTLYNRSVFDTASENLGKKGANSQVLGEGSLVDSFTASEHGFLMVLASLVPRPIYGSGCERRNFRTKVGDFAFPLLAGMGDQEIRVRELTGVSDHTNVFGYTDLYAEYKFRNDKIHGLISDTAFEFDGAIPEYALQRSFEYTDNNVQISSAFLQIPTDYLDQVQAVQTSTLGYSYWAEIYFPFKKISTLPAYSQPTLADLKNAHTEYISRGGKRL